MTAMKMGYEYHCESCNQMKRLEDMVQGEAEICQLCQYAYEEDQIKYYKPLWEAEQRMKVDGEDLTDHEVRKLKGMER